MTQAANLAKGTGTSANQIVALDGTGKLPAVDGSALTGIAASGRLLRAPQILTSGTSYTTPSNCTAIYVEVVGGGGGGGGAAFGSTNLAGAGSAGAYSAKYFTVTGNTAYTYAIGAGGSAGASGANAGGNAGNTTFTVGVTTITATGGNGGVAGSVSLKITAGVTGTNGDINVTSQPGLTIGASTSTSVILGGSTLFGAGGTTSAPGNGSAGSGYGSGGSGGNGSSGAVAGGAGSQGIIRIWEYS